MSKRDDEEREETGDDGGETVDETPANVVPIGGRELPRAVREPESSGPIYAFGAVPGGASYWAVHRMGLGGASEPLSWGAPGAAVELREWPLSELSEAEVQRRWGPGTYRVEWLGVSPRGGRKTITRGRVFTLRAPAEVAAAPPAAPSSSVADELGGAFDLATKIMGMIEHNADRKVEGYTSMAKLFANQSNGLGAAELTLILQKQTETTKELIAGVVAPLQRDLAELRAAKEEGGGIAGAAANAASGLVKGSGPMATALNFATNNPDLVKMALPLVAETLGKLAAIFTPPPPPKVIARALVEPIAPVVQQQPAPPVQQQQQQQDMTPEEVSPGSLSSWESRPPVGALQPPPPADAVAPS